MFSFLRRKSTVSDVIFPPITIPLTNIQEVDEAGIFYLDNEGNSANIHYVDAYKGWCKSKSIKRSKPKYICDRTKAEGWKLNLLAVQQSLQMLTEKLGVNGVYMLQIHLAVGAGGNFIAVNVIIVQAHQNRMLAVNLQLR